MTRARPIVALLLASSCLPAADHERLGDQAYLEGRFDQALSEYQAAQRGGVRSRVWAKIGAAALQARDLPAAVAGFRSLAEADPGRATEAAVGLERVIEAARARGGGAALTSQAVLALREVAPGRPLGRLAHLPLDLPDLSPAEFLGLVPTALATAATPSAVDSLLVRFGDALRATTACEDASGVYQAALRRGVQGRFRAGAVEGLASCALQLGLDALSAERGDVGQRWFEAVLGVERATPRAWRAEIGRGDARLLQGDVLGAAVAYQSVIGAAGAPDSLQALATARLNALGAAPDPPRAGP